MIREPERKKEQQPRRPTVIDDQVEPWPDMEDFPVERRAEFDAQLSGVELRGRWERERKKA